MSSDSLTSAPTSAFGKAMSGNKAADLDELPKGSKFWATFIGENEHVGGNVVNMEKRIRRGIGLVWCFVPFLILILGWALPAMRSSSNDGACVKWRPQGYVYIVAWFFIIFCMVVSWNEISKSIIPLKSFVIQAILVLFLILLSLMWLWRYHVNKLEGISVFVFLIMVLGIELPLAWSSSPLALAGLMPLLVWAIFQISLNATEMNCV